MRLSLLALLFACALQPAPAQWTPPTTFDPARDPAKDLREAVSLAQRSGKRILLDAGGEWCVWCRRLDTLFTTNRELLQFRDRNYVTLKVNYSKENKNEEFFSRYPKIPGYPHLFVLDSNGDLLHSQGTEELEGGSGYDPEKVYRFLKEWAPRRPKN